VSEALDATFTALADPRRRAALQALRAGPRRAGELAAAAGLSRPAMTRHLRVLRDSQLVEERPDPDDGRARVYHLRPERLTEVGDWLAQTTAWWSDQLDAFAAAAEGGP